jgi:serine/threonine protein kinase
MQLKIADFGAAGYMAYQKPFEKAKGPTIPAKASNACTARYAPPRLLMGNGTWCGFDRDIFPVGVVAYELAVGKKPEWEGKKNEENPYPKTDVAGAPPDFNGADGFVRSALKCKSTAAELQQHPFLKEVGLDAKRAKELLAECIAVKPAETPSTKPIPGQEIDGGADDLETGTQSAPQSA